MLCGCRVSARSSNACAELHMQHESLTNDAGDDALQRTQTLAAGSGQITAGPPFLTIQLRAVIESERLA